MNPNGYDHNFSKQRQKKPGTILGGLRNLNGQLKYKPYPMPKSRLKKLKLESFKYSTSLYFNMIYCHICFSEYVNNICTSILLWVK